jgi:hypothetical protein
VGRASSAKKVARAARAGGGRRPGQRRRLGFPLLVAVICVAGTALVLYARDQRGATLAPRAAIDHWHAAYGIAECGEFRPALSSAAQDQLGIHTHEDGLVHIEPLVGGAAGPNARLGLFLDHVGIAAEDDSISFADGSSWELGAAECDGEPAQIVLARWIDGQDAADGERPNDVLTSDFGSVRFRNDREAYMLALVPEGDLSEIPVRPDIVEALNEASEPAPPPATSTTSVSPTSTSIRG